MVSEIITFILGFMIEFTVALIDMFGKHNYSLQIKSQVIRSPYIHEKTAVAAMIRRLEERAGALEGDLTAIDGRERDGVPDGVHEGREPRGGLADARVVEAHEAAAARRVAGVLPSPLLAVPVLVLVPVPRRPPAAAAVGVVIVVAAPVLLLDGCLVELLLQPRQHPAPHAGARDEAAHAARLVGQVELRPAEHLGARRLVRSQDQGSRHH